MIPKQVHYHYADDGFSGVIETNYEGDKLVLKTMIHDKSREVIMNSTPLRLMALREFLDNMIGEIEKIESEARRPWPAKARPEE